MLADTRCSGAIQQQVAVDTREGEAPAESRAPVVLAGVWLRVVEGEHDGNVAQQPQDRRQAQ